MPISGLALAEASEIWTKVQEARVATMKKRASSLVSELYRLTSVLSFMGGDDLVGITEHRINQYQQHRLNARRSPSTVNSEVSTLLHVLAWAKKRKLIRELPDCEQIPVWRREHDLPTTGEAARILEHLSGRTRLLVHLLAETGCRKSEAFTLTWEDVDVVNGVLRIRAKDGFTPKTQHSQRQIPITGALLDGLRALDTKSVYVFPGRKRNGSKREQADTPVTDIDKALAKAVKEAGVMRNGRPMKITPKLFRKANITWQQERGVPVAILQPLVGHAPGSRITLQSYTFATREAQRAAVLNLPVGPTHSDAQTSSTVTETGTDLATSGNTQSSRA
jgi:integrase